MPGLEFRTIQNVVELLHWLSYSGSDKNWKQDRPLQGVVFGNNYPVDIQKRSFTVCEIEELGVASEFSRGAEQTNALQGRRLCLWN